MKYTYENWKYSENAKTHLRTHVCTRIEEATKQFTVDGFGAFIDVFDNARPSSMVAIAKLTTGEEIEEFIEIEARNEQWKDKPVDKEEWKPMENLLEDSPPSLGKPFLSTTFY